MAIPGASFLSGAGVAKQAAVSGEPSAMPMPAGLRVLLVAPSPPPYGGMALQARRLERLLRLDGIAVVFLPSNVPFPRPLRFLDRLRGVRPLLRAVALCRRLWKEAGRAEVVHVLAASWLYFFLVVYPAVAIARMRGARVIVNYRGGEAARFFRWFGWAARPAFRWASEITVPSEFLGGLIRACFSVPVRIVPNIVDLSAFQFRLRAPIGPRMIVSRHLEKSYGIENVVRAFGQVQSRYPNASLRIAGTGSEEAGLRRLVSENGLRNVEFLGHIPQDRLPALYEESDIFLNASVVDNFPGALIEASAAGLVVVSTRAAGIPYIYSDGVDALLAEPGTPQDLAGAVVRVLENPALARSLAVNGAAVARQCDWREVRRPLYEAYGVTMAGAMTEATAN